MNFHEIYKRIYKNGMQAAFAGDMWEVDYHSYDLEKDIMDFVNSKLTSQGKLSDDELGQNAMDAFREVKSTMDNWPAMNSAHEGYGVLLEEVDELWNHVKTKQKNRDLEAMKKEAIQVAAMALRFATEVCNERVGRK